MRTAHPGAELVCAKGERLGKISPQQRNLLTLTLPFKRNVERKHRREARNVVVPEDSFDFGQISFVQKGAVGRRLEVDASNFNIERVFLGGNHKVGAQGAKFAIDLVADVGGHTNHRRRDGYAQRNGRTCQQLAPLLPPEGFVNQPNEHRLLLCEHATAGRNVRLLKDDRVCRLGGLEWHRIAASGRSHRRWIDGRSAILAGHSVGRLVKADRPADLAGVKNSGYLAVRLLIQPEEDRSAIFLRLKTVQVAIRNLRQRDTQPAIRKSHLGRRGRIADALGINELRRDQRDEDEREREHCNHPHTFAAGAPCGLAGLRGGGGGGHRFAPLGLKQNHQRRQRKYGHKEKPVVTDNRANDRHLPLGGGNDSAFGKLVQPGDHQLRRYQKQDGSGDAEKLLQIDANTTL